MSVRLVGTFVEESLRGDEGSGARGVGSVGFAWVEIVVDFVLFYECLVFFLWLEIVYATTLTDNLKLD